LILGGRLIVKTNLSVKLIDCYKVEFFSEPVELEVSKYRIKMSGESRYHGICYCKFYWILV